MSSFKYDSFVSALGQKQINWITDTFKVLLVSGDYSPSKSTDQFVSDIPSQAIVVRSGSTTGNAIVGGVFRSNVPEFLALASTSEAVAMVIYKDTGADDSSQLVYYSADGIGFPFLPGGINYFLAYDQANGGWFQ